MPWRQTNVMQQREMFINAWLSQKYSKIALCRQFGISRVTGDKWIVRFKQGGMAALADHSSRPAGCPRATNARLCELLCAAKREHPSWGAKKLLALLRRRAPHEAWPADSTGDLILKRAGLVKARKPRRGISADASPFTAADAPNQSWSVDFKGDFAMRGGRCFPLTVSDNYSRKLLCCHGLASTAYAGVWPQFERLFAENGMPWSILSDNGTPFAARSLGGLSRLSKQFIDLGIRVERTNPGHPEQNGRHERMHRSLKAWLAGVDSVREELSTLRMRLDAFMKEYNEERMHEGLGGAVPSALYRPSPRAYTGRIVPYEYDSQAIIRSVRQSGEIKWRGRMVHASALLAGERIALLPYGDGVWEVRYRFHPLGFLNDRMGRIEPLTQWREIARPETPRCKQRV